MEAFGLHDLLREARDKEILANRLRSVEVRNGDNDPSWEHSEHAPVIADFKM